MFKIIPHTADIGLSVTAASREELFADAVFGLRSLLLSKISLKNSDLKKIQLEAITLEDLLVQWLSELNFLVLRSSSYSLPGKLLVLILDLTRKEVFQV